MLLLIAWLGQKADPTKDKITVDGKPIAAARFNLQESKSLPSAQGRL